MTAPIIVTTRDLVRNQSTAWLQAAISDQGRHMACGWHDHRGSLTVRGALAIAVVRAELRRRAGPPPPAPRVPHYVDRETAYGSTFRLSRSIRVF